MRRTRGFTLVEMVVVIVITGIVAAAVAVFVRQPVEGYVDSVRRAELTDAADVALRRLARDVRLALPNSLRVMTGGGVHYIEFIMTQSGGRYRDETDGSSAGDFLDFRGDTSFDVLGPVEAAPGDFVVIYNLGVPGADAYAGNNRAQVRSAGGGNLVLTASQVFPFRSPGARFQVVPGGVGAVTYACPQAGAGDLMRHWNYGFNPAQAIPAAGLSARLTGQARCEVEYAANATGRNGLLYVRLTLTSGGESVTLFNQIHVDNAP
ncbi:MAG: prepilin-type N-terminal cleavage/methylation domain-containing protein [Sulfuritalea sp.]|nr:prepilin-type N-terminal cleavage/methylation domain-containing protein [Sulfuritalea sp.]